MKRTALVMLAAGVLSISRGGELFLLAYQEGQPGTTLRASGSSAITGRVVLGAGGTGIGEAVVTAVETGSGLTKSAATDALGAFALRDLPGGRYVLSATKMTFIPGRYGQSAPGEMRRVLVVTDGKAESGIEIRLWKAGVVSGRIVSQSGEPFPGATINLVRMIVDGDVRRLMPIRASAVSADTGEYRVFGIEPGDYFLVAAPPALGHRMGLEQKTGPRPTFYANSVKPETAQAITVAADGAVTADIVMQTGRLGGVEGTVADGAGLTGLVVRATAPGLASVLRTVVAQGRFGFLSLPEGAYSFYSDPVRDSAGRVTVFAADAEVDGYSRHPTAVALRPIRASVLTGAVRLPPGAKLTGPLSATIGAQPRFDSRMLGPSPSVAIDKEGHFSFVAWPGPNGILATVRTPGLYVKAIRLNGVDVTDEGVSVKDGTDVHDIEVELTETTQTITGRVTKGADANEALEDLAVAMFPRDRQLWRSVRRTTLIGVTLRGEFTVKSMPPGTYALALVPGGLMANVRDPRVLEQLMETAKVVTLSSGETATVVLRR